MTSLEEKMERVSAEAAGQLPATDGGTVRLSEAVAGGPVILSFYRGRCDRTATWSWKLWNRRVTTSRSGGPACRPSPRRRSSRAAGREVRWASVSPDYSRRPDPSETLEALDRTPGS